MKIQRIKVSNFKSFHSLDVELTDFNVLIGANAAGKSNFIRIFRFLRDIIDHGLENAVQLQGGVEFLRNINRTGTEDRLEFCISMLPDKPFKFSNIADQDQLFEIGKLIYEFSLGFNKENTEFNIIHDSLYQEYCLYNISGNKRSKLASGDFTINKNGQDISFDFAPAQQLNMGPGHLQDIFLLGQQSFLTQKRLLNKKIVSRSLLLEMPLFFIPHIENIKSDIHKIAMYDFEPKLPKRATKIAGKADLEENGENLAIVLRRILADPDNSRALYNFINDILPFVDDLDVEKMFDRSLLLKLKEVYATDHYLPASLISDGTINVIALIIALYFEDNPVCIIEEAERRIHPHLISKVVDMMEDASSMKQIIVSTHNPEIVKYAGFSPDNLLLVSRDKSGYSTIIKPGEKAEIKTFMENDLGIEDLYVQNLLK